MQIKYIESLNQVSDRKGTVMYVVGNDNKNIIIISKTSDAWYGMWDVNTGGFGESIKQLSSLMKTNSADIMEVLKKKFIGLRRATFLDFDSLKFRLNRQNYLCGFPKTTADQIVDSFKGIIGKNRYLFGTELELEYNDEYYECPDSIDVQRKLKDATTKQVIQDVGTDITVNNGIEVRFAPLEYKDAVGKDIKKCVKILKNDKFGNAHLSAGQHIHCSSSKVGTVEEKLRADDNLRLMQEILYPTNDRKPETPWGIGSNLFRLYNLHNTVEFRAWAATTDVKVFTNRIKLTRWLYKFLESTKPLNEVFMYMPKNIKKVYIDLVNSCTRHNYGKKPDEIIPMVLQGTKIE